MEDSPITTSSERDFLKTSKTIDYDYGNEDFEETVLFDNFDQVLHDSDESEIDGSVFLRVLQAYL